MTYRRTSRAAGPVAPFGAAREGGFSLFELTVVIIVIGLLVYTAAHIFAGRIEQSQATVVNFQANTFARTVGNLHAARSAIPGPYVPVDGGVHVYFNENGWPASTLDGQSPSLRNQTQAECESLWMNLFSKATQSGENSKKSSELFKVVLKDRYTCRYELTGKTEGSYYFDYDVRTGKVQWQTPEQPGSL